MSHPQVIGDDWWPEVLVLWVRRKLWNQWDDVPQTKNHNLYFLRRRCLKKFTASDKIAEILKNFIATSNFHIRTGPSVSKLSSTTGPPYVVHKTHLHTNLMVAVCMIKHVSLIMVINFRLFFWFFVLN